MINTLLNNSKINARSINLATFNFESYDYNKLEKLLSVKQVISFLLLNNMVGVIWSPKHLFIVIELLMAKKPFHKNYIALQLHFASMCMDAIKNYRVLTFDEIYGTKLELETSIAVKIAGKFNIPLCETCVFPLFDQLQEVENYCCTEWEYMKTTQGREISM